MNLGTDFISVLPGRFGTRIESITKLTRTENRILTSYDDLTVVDRSIDEKNVQDILTAERKNGFDFLRKAISQI